jgi:hypothetical protein
MKQIPFFIPLNVVLGANAIGNLIYSVPSLWIVHMLQMFFTSTAAFRINAINDSTGVNYSTASQSTPILSSFLSIPTTANIGLLNLQKSLDLDGNKSLVIQVQDTSGAGNTINCVINAMAEYPQ